MAGRLLTCHDVDLSEYLHANGFRVLAAEDTATLETMATIPVQQSSNHLLMVAPTAFERNELAAQDNFFMAASDTTNAAAAAAEVAGSDAASADALRRAVLGEFASLYTLLTSRCPGGVGARVHLFTHEAGTPDAVFPNNWFSTHTNLETDAAAGACTLVFYPMRAANRRQERRPALLARLEGFRRYTHVIDLSRQETAAEPRFLEGTGSLVLDRIHRVAYAAISERTDARLAAAWGRLLGYTVVPFHAVDGGGRPIYHTNGTLREERAAAGVAGFWGGGGLAGLGVQHEGHGRMLLLLVYTARYDLWYPCILTASGAPFVRWHCLALPCVGPARASDDGDWHPVGGGGRRRHPRRGGAGGGARRPCRRRAGGGDNQPGAGGGVLWQRPRSGGPRRRAGAGGEHPRGAGAGARPARAPDGRAAAPPRGHPDARSGGRGGGPLRHWRAVLDAPARVPPVGRKHRACQWGLCARDARSVHTKDSSKNSAPAGGC